MRLTAQPLCWINLLENTQCDETCFSVGQKKTQVQRFKPSKWKHDGFNKKYMGLFHFWYDTAVLPDFGRDFPFLSCRQVGGWLTNSTCESDAMPSHPYRIASEWSGTWKSHHPTDSWDHCIFPHPSFYGRGGGCFTKIGTVLVKVRTAPESMWYSWGRPLFLAKKDSLIQWPVVLRGDIHPPSEPRNFIFIQVWENQSFGWLESCQVHSWKGIPKIRVTSQVRCLQSAKWMEHHKKT